MASTEGNWGKGSSRTLGIISYNFKICKIDLDLPMCPARLIDRSLEQLVILIQPQLGIDHTYEIKINKMLIGGS